MDSLGYVAVRCGNLRGQLGISSSCVTDELGRIMRGPDFAQIAAGFRQNDWEVSK